jgi:hypothetical protein
VHGYVILKKGMKTRFIFGNGTMPCFPEGKPAAVQCQEWIGGSARIIKEINIYDDY